MTYTNPNEKWYSESNKLEQRKVFYCAKMMKPFVKGSVIDLGAGTGKVTDYLVKNNPKVKDILCLDFSNIHKEILKNKGYKFQRQNLDEPPYDIPGDSFDTVISSDVVEHLLSPYAYFNECFRVLKGGGALILSTPDVKREKINVPHINYFTPKTVEFYLRRVGFKKRNIKRVYNGILNETVTQMISKIPLLRNWLSLGCYYVAKK